MPVMTADRTKSSPTIVWTPRHRGIEDNEVADACASVHFITTPWISRRRWRIEMLAPSIGTYSSGNNCIQLQPNCIQQPRKHLARSAAQHPELSHCIKYH